jgi:DNA-binding MarR family transcriptional regulator
VDRLVTAGLVQRSTSAQDRRRVDLTLTEAGERLLEQVMADRRRELGALMATMSPVDRAHLAQGMSALAAAAGEPPVHAPLPF